MNNFDEKLEFFCKKNGIFFKKIIKLKGDASSRNYFRIECEKETFVASIGPSAELKETNGDFLDIQNVLEKKHLRVPSVKLFDLEQGIIVQEDLGDNSLQDFIKSLNEDGVKKVYQDCIDQLIKIQKINVKESSGKNFSNRKFDLEKFLFEEELAKEYLLQKYKGYKFSKQELDQCQKSFNIINDQILSQEYVFCHRDFHSRNIMIKDGKLVIIDFQDARMGPYTYDLVSLLEDSYIFLPLELKKELKKYYFSKTNHKSFEKFEEDYHFMAAQRIFKAMGSFTYLNYQKKDSSYLKYVEPTFEGLLKNLVAVSDLREWSELLKKIFYEN